MKFFYLLFLCLLANYLFPQKKTENYFDFFGRKYILTKEPELRDQYGDDFIGTTRQKSEFFFKSKFRSRIKRNELDSIGNSILITSDRLKSGIIVYSLEDSVNLDVLKKVAKFEVYFDTSKCWICGFKIYGNNSSEEFEFISAFPSGDPFDQTSNMFFVKQIIEQMKSSTRFLLTEIFFYSPTLRKKIGLDISLLLKK